MAKDSRQNTLNMIFSVFDDELKWLGGRLGDWLPILRSNKAGRLIGPLKSFIEGRAKNMNPFLGATIEKFTDVLDFASVGKSESETPGQIATDLISRLKKDAAERLKKAPPEEIEATAKRIRKEFKQLIQLMKFFDQAVASLPKPAPPPPPDYTMATEWLKKQNEKLRAALKARGVKA